ncbi:NADP-dependent 3-hydroxy acid dehydrogenase YdfG [Saccharopolyspora antimicrobica]|uniref:NADP-dependent 3-hydroxy acid dehydrogenase YdfG n=1 Tax=Saccharopolyspora antimicrobica TaxID=455193 RepID=A0A1I5IX48_9PSEU|nr:SDR family NAD(P)-dependent oxidoreductase [Saccharopolyspora antimicrobica]RKT83753.1 NADP-dependent 3-hydroxy acid dehydrogenase YdfG [Saccharopolyspora antimicrobica]SFO65087.1 NADP-dependent 3-hydroxy acid dehydrogenase YdfG [Saccharopolyspora antimicrobica]
MRTSSSRTWFITGAARGLGRAFTEAALDAGDRVVGVARDVTPLDELAAASDGRLVAFSLDVSDRAAVFAGVERAVAAFGGLDVVVNNAGGAILGMLEELTEEQIRTHLDTNFFGALWVSQAVVPHLREQGSGHILQVSSMGSVGGFASTGIYGAGKAALDSMSAALAMEVERFGIKVTILGPGGYQTDLFTRGLTMAEGHEAYAPLREWLQSMWTESQDFDPKRAAEVVVEVVNMPEPPKHLILGSAAYDMVDEMNRAYTAELAKWEHLSRKAE